ncbi:leucine/isoleucine/valine transporter permease subunit [Anoxybacillus sp. BCO1]|nr:leucine/isoleucine/valine transporter permease subunit [Anoxybacillus sp. BCO1]
MIGVYIATTFISLYLAQKSVVAFLLLLSSLLFLYFTSFSNRVKWVIGILVLSVLLPLAASQGEAYQSYMEVATLVGIYIAMALGLNIVVGLAGLLDLGFVAFLPLVPIRTVFSRQHKQTTLCHLESIRYPGKVFGYF